jgi:hypothetical protein
MFTFGKSKPEASLSALEALCKANRSFSSLPDTIRIPAAPGHNEIAAKPISEATIDDLAFALRGLDGEFNDLTDKMHALRKLSQMARDAGGVGTDCAVEVAARIQAEC